MSVELNKTLFNARLRTLLDAWGSAANDDDYAPFAECDALLVLAGDPAPEDEPMRKSVAFQQWLLGFEFPTTFILVEKEKAYILCSAKKAKIVAQIQTADSPIPIEILQMEKGKDAASSQALTTFAEHYAAHARVGHLAKDTHTGKIIDEWNAAVKAAAAQPQLVDAGPALSAVLCAKDDEELRAIRTAANLTSTLLAHHIAVKLEMILDRETKLSHEQFSAQIEARLGGGDKDPDQKVWSKGKGLANIDWPAAEFCYPPIIQSRSSSGGYDIKPSAESSTDNLAHQGVLIVAVGMRYKGYNANLGRTFIVDPTKEQETIYKSLLELQSELLAVMVEGAVAKDVYTHALDYVRRKHPDLEKHFPKNIGFAMGLEFRDSSYVLNAKNTRQLRANMVFNLALGLEGMDEGKGRKYSLLLADTVKVASGRAVLLTEGCKMPKETLFFINQDEKPAAKPAKAASKSAANGSPVKNKTAGTKVLRTKTRSAAQDDVQRNTTSRIADHQRELFELRQRDGVAKYSEEGDGTGKGEGKQWKRFQSYKGEGGLPTEVESLRIFVDRKASTVILPINGFSVPFHINTIKNVGKTEEGEWTYLRVNFQTPGQLAGKKEDTPFEDPDATFIRSVSYRSTDSHRFDSLHKQINDLKKEITKREQQKKQMADVIEQDRLQEIKGRRPVKLAESFVRPALDGKRLPGEVEIHQNGLCYTSPGSSHRIDVLFSNIKHLFFQPCDNELLVIIHLHLKAPILVGKKKAHDIQFYREASDVQFDETGNRKRKYRYGDEDEIEMEQQERKRRQILNRDFKDYAEKIAEALSQSTGEQLEVDIPFRELSFEGVPFRTNVRLHPTTDCLVHLSDPPFMIVTLNEVEVASLERVQFSLKQFDMVLIFRDFAKAPLHINSIPTSQLDDVKNWLDSCDIPLGEGPVNLNWGSIMKTINENPYEFFREGGWRTFLGGGSAESDQSSGSESESEYSQEAESDEPDVEDSESDFSDDDASDDDASGSDFDDGGDGSSEGDDWDELERKAAKSDKKRIDEGRLNGKMDDSDEDERPKKKSNGKSSGGKPSGKPSGKTSGKPSGKANGKATAKPGRR